MNDTGDNTVVSENDINLVVSEESFLDKLTQLNPDIESLIKEINSGNVDLKHSDVYGDNALIMACQDEQLKEVARALITIGNTDIAKLDLGYVNKNGDTALMMACYNGLIEVATALIATGKSKPDTVNYDGETALTYVCRNGMREVALALIDTGISAPGQVANDGLTALILACHTKLVDVALELIKTNQSKPGHIDGDGDTALMVACRNELLDVAQQLIDTRKSKPGQVNREGDTALIIACRNGLSGVAQQLIETDKSKLGHVNNNGNTALIIACQVGLSDVALKLIDKGKDNPEQNPNPGQVNNNKDTALIIACQNGLSDVALKLIDKCGVNLYQVDKDGFSVLDYATQNDLSEVINAFPKDEININQTGFSAETVVNTVIQDYLKETPGNIVFLFNGQYYHTSKKSLKKQLIITNVKYGCKKAGDSLQFVLDENVMYDTPYLSLSSVFPVQILIKLEDADKIIDPLSGNMFVLRNTGLKLPAIVSEDFLRGSGGASSDHCQPGKATDVYAVFVASPVCGAIANVDEKDDALIAVQKNNFIIRYKEKNYTIPVGQVNSVEELNNLFLDQLVSQEVVPDKNYKVRLLFGSGIVCDEKLKKIKEDPSNSVIQAVVNKQNGGKRTKKVKRVNRVRKTKRAKRTKRGNRATLAKKRKTKRK